MTLTKHLIADYLKRNGLDHSLKAFEKESGIDTRTTTVTYEKLEDIVDDRTAYLTHSEVLKESEINIVENSHLFKPWNDENGVSAKGTEVNIGGALVIHVSVCQMKIDGELKSLAMLSSADRSITLVDVATKSVFGKYTGIHGSVVKCCYGIPDTDLLLACGMDGKVKLVKITGHDSTEVISDYQLHPRLVTDLKLLQVSEDEYLIFSIGWDLTVRAHRLKNTKFEYFSQFKLLSNATAIEVSTYEDQPVVLITRLDSSQIAYFTLKNDTLLEVTRVSLNDAEFSTHGFTGMSISLSTDVITKDTQIAVGTSHIPYLRVIVTRPPDFKTLLEQVKETGDEGGQQLSTPTLRGYILANFTTVSPQDKFSQAKVVWRYDGSGVWISGDDGIIRGLELKTGAIVEELIGHDEKQRVKCLGVIGVDGQEVLVSAGVDKKVIVW